MRERIVAASKMLGALLAVMMALATFFAAATPAIAQNPDTPRRFELRIENFRLAGGAITIQVQQGEAVELLWRADRRSTVHVHGYDIEATIDAGAPRTTAFRAHASGRFPIELHDAGHRVLLYLEVHPR